MFAEHENDEFERHLSNAGACNKLLARLREHHPEKAPPAILKVAREAAAIPELPKVESVPITAPASSETAFPIIRAYSPVRTIARSASAHFNMSLAELLSERRTKEAVRARHVVMYLTHKLTTLSLPRIAQQMGGMDHTTILHGVRKVKDRIATDQALSDDVAAVRELAIAADPALGALA